MNSDKNELYKQSLEKHMTALLSASQSYDKAILSLSIAALGFTFAFVRLVPHVNHTCLLPFTWFFLIAAIVFVLLSFLIDQRHSHRRIEHLYSNIVNKLEKDMDPHWEDKWMVTLPIIAGVFFVTAITLFTIFASQNIH